MCISGKTKKAKGFSKPKHENARPYVREQKFKFNFDMFKSDVEDRDFR